MRNKNKIKHTKDFGRKNKMQEMQWQSIQAYQQEEIIKINRNKDGFFIL